MRKRYIKKHNDGSVWAKGYMDGKVMVGFWEWFRKTGTIMRSGNFKNSNKSGSGRLMIKKARHLK